MALALRRESRVRKHNFARDRLACVAKFGIDAPAVLLPDDRTRRPLALLGFSGCGAAIFFAVIAFRTTT